MDQQGAMKEWLESVKEIYDDGFAEINGREYHFTEMNHTIRRQVYAYFTHVKEMIASGDFYFMTTPDFERIEKLMWGRITFNGSVISKREGHWDQCPEDYQALILTAMSVISYPFLRGAVTNSQSRNEAPVKTTLKKPL